MWIITKDLLENGQRTGTASRDYDEARLPSLKHRFRLLCDDGETIYEGLSDDCDSQRAFSPLDNFGMGDAGCTEIQYSVDGCWRSL